MKFITATKPPCLPASSEELFTLPIENLPSDTMRVKRKQRPGMQHFAYAYVQTPIALTQYTLSKAESGKLVLGYIIAINGKRAYSPFE